MYVLVLRQLSPMQKGIQGAHAIVEYANKYGDTDEYRVWSRVDKTIVMLDGGTNPDLKVIKESLGENNVIFSEFKEEDLGNITTAISLLADDRVFDRETHPDFEKWRLKKNHSITVYPDLKYNEDYKEWVDTVMGGEKNDFLRSLLCSKRLAQ